MEELLRFVLARGALVPAALLGLTALLALRKNWGRIRALPSCEEGQAMIETAISFPVIIFFTLAVMQLALIYIGGIMANYAAFNAARSAIVWIPEKGEEEEKNVLKIEVKENDAGLKGADAAASKKVAIIESAAFLSMIPSSGNAMDVLSDFATFGMEVANPTSERWQRLRQGLEAAFQMLGDLQNLDPGAVQNQIEQTWDAFTEVNDQSTVFRALGGGHGYFMNIVGKALYSYYYTRINFLDADGNPIESEKTFEPGEPVTVEVSHDFLLGVPVVNRMIGHAIKLPFPTGPLHYGAHVIHLKGRATLRNEGYAGVGEDEEEGGEEGGE